MLKSRKSVSLALALGLAVSPFALASASAQETMPAPAEQPPAAAPLPDMAPAPEVDDAKLQSFVTAFLQVNEVGQEYQPQLEAAAGDEAEQARLQEEASAQMVQVVENSDGITVEEYSAILTSAQSDPDLAGQINELIRQNVGGEEQPMEQPMQ